MCSKQIFYKEQFQLLYKNKHGVIINLLFNFNKQQCEGNVCMATRVNEEWRKYVNACKKITCVRSKVTSNW